MDEPSQLESEHSHQENDTDVEPSDLEQFDLSEDNSSEHLEDETVGNEFFSEGNEVINENGLTLHDGFLAVLSFSQRHKLSGKAVEDVLKLISIFQPKLKKNSLYFFIPRSLCK